MKKPKRGFIKCPYCAEGIYKIASQQKEKFQYELIVDGLNELELTVSTDDASITEFIPMNFCFMSNWCRRWARDKSWDKAEVKE